jgi:putative thiamine transport system substrate-binding protein
MKPMGTTMKLLLTMPAALLILFSAALSCAAEWSDILKEARGQTVYFNAWGGSQVINDYISWAGKEAKKEFGIRVVHVKVSDLGEVVSRVLVEKSTGRKDKGSVDLMWINGENFRAMKENHLLYGPFTHRLPNTPLVDTENKPTTLFDFTVPVDNMEAPWGMALLVFQYDTRRIDTPPGSMDELLALAQTHPGRVTYPAPPSFYGTTFIKQALLELTDTPGALNLPVNQADFYRVTGPLWQFLDRLHPLMWRKGKVFTKGAPGMKQLLNDSEIFISLSFNPNDAANAIANGELPESIRTYVHRSGTIGNTHFLGIPYNASAVEGAMVFADFLLSPRAQARKSDPEIWGDPTVLNLSRLSPENRALFEKIPVAKGCLPLGRLAKVLPEPHPSWVEALEKAWQNRYSK